MNTDILPKCPQCGLPLPPNAPAGLCPRCLMVLNLKTETVFTDDTPAAQPPLPPEQIAPHFPQLEILECLGRGGMGVVYKARQKTLNRLVALKLLAPERVGDVKFAERFTREAQALAALNHPNIVTIHDFGQAGGYYYLLMEFVDGANLRQLLRARKFTPEEALAIVPPLCDALQFAHERGIIHRDIKPENLLLDKAGRVKVADFGIAKMLGDVGQTFQSAGAGDFPVASQSGGNTGLESPVNPPAGKPALQPSALTGEQTVGTPGYSAPEQKTDPQHVDSRADIYSLGVVFYEMLTGELPGKQLQPPSKKVQIDVRLDEIVLRALEKKPELRYQQVSEVKTLVETIASTSGGSRREEAQTESERQKAESGKPGENLVSSTATELNPWQPVLAFLGMIGCLILFIIGFILPFPANLIPLVIAPIVFIVAGLKLAGFWPWPSPLFPRSNWTGRNLPSVKKKNSPAGNSRREEAQIEKTGIANPKPEMPPRFSPTAILGTLLIPVFFVSTVFWNFGHLGGLSAAVGVIMSTLGFVSIVTATVLGWVAVVQIRRASGQLCGMWLALVDGLVLPGLVLNVVLLFGLLLANKFLNVWLLSRWYPVLEEHAFINNPHFLIWLLFATAAVIGSNYVVIRGLWRALNQPANGSVKAAGSGWKTPLIVVAAVMAVLVAAALVASHFHPERPFYIGQKNFPQGDHIEITSVERSTNRMIVKGYYNLVSHDQAMLALYITATNENVPEDARQKLQIAKGRGDFELLEAHLVPGWPHVSMYATNGQPFASIYFGTKAEALEESKAVWITNTPTPAATGYLTPAPNNYISQQTKAAEAGNGWAQFNLWNAYYNGTHEMDKNQAKADKWLAALIQGVYLAKFEPVNGFNPATPQAMLDQFSQQCRLFSGSNSLGGASFFRTTPQDGKLIGSFLTELPDEFEAAVEKSASFKLISMEKVTPELFLAHEAAAQESLPPNTNTSAISAARTWLALIDAGNYSETWNEASAIVQGAVTEASWENSMNTFRKPLGELVSRNLKSAQSMTELPGAPDGQYVVMQFETSFANKKSAIETVTFMLEKDGAWKSAGYFIK